MIVLGIDPGTTRIGYGAIESHGSSLKLIVYGVIETSGASDAAKIGELAKAITALIKKTRPALCGIEKIYFSKNQKTALAVAQARGAIMHACIQNNLAIVEIRPSEAKQAVTGYGLADKKAVAKMVKKILRTDDLSGHDDASDALAIAIAAVNSRRLPGAI